MNRRRTHCAIVCNIIVASDIPRPAPPSSSGRAIPIQPSLANAACSSWGYRPDSSCSAQYSYEIFGQSNSSPSMCSKSKCPVIHDTQEREKLRTSGKFEQIFSMASRTISWFCEKQLRSIILLDGEAEKDRDCSHCWSAAILGMRAWRLAELRRERRRRRGIIVIDGLKIDSRLSEGS